MVQIPNEEKNFPLLCFELRSHDCRLPKNKFMIMSELIHHVGLSIILNNLIAEHKIFEQTKLFVLHVVQWSKSSS